MAVIAASAAVAAGKAERAEQLLAAAPAASSQPEGSAQDAPASWLPLIRAELAARDSNFHKVAAQQAVKGIMVRIGAVAWCCCNPSLSSSCNQG